MTFLELQQELSTVPGHRFKSTQASSYKKWINARAAELWGLEDWTFRKAYASLSVTGSNDAATSPSDLGVVLGIWDSDGDPITYLPVADFAARHISNTSTSDTTVYTVVNKSILLDPTPSGSSSAWKIYYDRAYCHLSSGGAYVAGDMSADTDVPALPAETHYLLVHGATAMGSVNMNDFTYQFAEQAWLSGIESMRRNYLVDQRGATQQWGALSADATSW